MMLLRIIYLAFPLILGGILQSLVLSWNLCAKFAVPLDQGLVLRGKRVFGDNKTLRGLIVMVLGSMIGMHLQGSLYSVEVFHRLSFFDYSEIDLSWAGAALGLGFILGELPNSFVKRQCNVAPGGRGTGLFFWFFTVLDQIDSIIGCLVAAALTFWVPDRTVVMLTIVLGVLLHMAVNAVFVIMRVKVRVF